MGLAPFQRESAVMEKSRTPAPQIVDAINTRREVLSQGALLSAGALAATAFAGALTTEAHAETSAAADQSLYTRLGGIFAIAAVVNYFSDEIIQDPVA